MRNRRLRWAATCCALTLAAAVVAACSSSANTSTPPAGQGSSTGSGNSTSAQKVNLTFWQWVPGMDKAVALWNSTHPNIHVTLQNIPSGGAGGYAKIHAALKAGNAPDLAQIEYQEIPGFLLDKGLVDLSQYGASQYESQFVPWQWKQGVYNNGVYAIPQASGPMGFFYRADLFRQAGITRPPATWAEYEQDAVKIHQRNPNEYIGTFPPGNSAWFTALAWQAGTKWFGTNGNSWTVDIDNPATEKVAAYWDRLRTEGVIKTEPDFANGWYKDLQTGNIAGWVSAQWGDAILKGNAPKTSGKWRVAPLPQWTTGADASANWGGSSTAVLTGSKHIKEALQFAVWLNSNPQSIALLIQGGYGWPAATAGFQGSALDQPSAFFGGQDYNKDVFENSDRTIDESWGWIPTIDQAYQHLDDGFSAAVNGQGSFLDTVRKAQGQVISDLKAAGLSAVAAS
jgi:multiple sugar transport system substrate-binding protein